MSFNRLIFSSRILSLVEYTREFLVVARIDERFSDEFRRRFFDIAKYDARDKQYDG